MYIIHYSTSVFILVMSVGWCASKLPERAGAVRALLTFALLKLRTVPGIKHTQQHVTEEEEEGRNEQLNTKSV